VLNAAEVNFFRSNNRYATFPELVKSGNVGDVPTASLNLQADFEPMPGFRLRLLLAPDGSQYALSLTRNTPECEVSLFSNESGIVYQAKSDECTTSLPGGPAAVQWAPPDIDEKVPSTRTDVPCPLPKVVHEASLRVQALVANLQQFSANEQIQHTEFRKDGRPRGVSRDTFNYVAQINDEAGGPSVEEYRTGKHQDTTTEPRFYDTGSAAFALIFHPQYIGDYQISCEGLSDSNSRPAWQVRFAQRPDRPNNFHILRLSNKFFPLSLKGRAWIAADNFEVLRLETDLLRPIDKSYLEKEHISKVDLKREHLAIEYGPVEFRKRNVRLWLPQMADIYIDLHGHRYERRHRFSNFQLFWIESGEQVKAPPGPENGKSENN